MVLLPLRDVRMMNDEIQQFRYYHATVRIRRGEGWEVRPEAEALDGQGRLFMASWQMDDNDPYPGEWAMTIEDGPPTRLLWVASGDLVDIERAGWDPMLSRAAEIEGELFKLVVTFKRIYPHHNLDVVERAALLIQQMRLRLNGSVDVHLAEDVADVRDHLRNDPSTIEIADRLDEAPSLWREALGLEADGGRSSDGAS